MFKNNVAYDNPNNAFVSYQYRDRGRNAERVIVCIGAGEAMELRDAILNIDPPLSGEQRAKIAQFFEIPEGTVAPADLWTTFAKAWRRKFPPRELLE
jgi:hypothetical protein